VVVIARSVIRGIGWGLLISAILFASGLFHLAGAVLVMGCR
jgi:hypothetical protein